MPQQAESEGVLLEGGEQGQGVWPGGPREEGVCGAARNEA